MQTQPSVAPPAAEALLARMRAAAAPAAAVAVFESAFHRIPAFASAVLLADAASLYAQLARPAAARLLGDLARQMRGEPSVATALSAEAAAILAHPLPATGLLRRLEQLDQAQAPQAAAALFEAVLPRMRPIDDYWIHYRMSLVYAALGQPEPAFLLACIAVQIEPAAAESLLPWRTVVTWLLGHEAVTEAARVVLRWSRAHPAAPLLDAGSQGALLALAGHVPLDLAAGRRDRELVAADTRPAQSLEPSGPQRALPYALQPLLQAQPRPAITLAELDGADLLVAEGAVAVCAADGVAQPDLSVGASPGLVRARLDERQRRGEAVDEWRFEQVVLIADQFPASNLCHFMLDQATRLVLYAQAGIDLANAIVVGPDLARPYQREIARRMGARRYLGTAGFGRVRAGRLAVLSNCRHLRHSAHLGAAWAVGGLRRAFADLLDQASPPRRLLISRADAAGRRLVNEDAALAALQPYGFERIVPGRMALDNQVRAFAAATHVVAAHGAALANIVFCAPGTRVLEVFHPHYGTSAYAMLAPALRLRYAALIGRDGASDAAADNDPALAAVRADMSLDRHILVDPDRLRIWMHSIMDA